SLAMDDLASGLVRTYWAAGPITDSAPAGTAMATGVKSTAGYIAVRANIVSMPGVEAVTDETKKAPVVTVLEAAKAVGKATGIISTSQVQHATPATFTSHYTDRNQYEILAEQQVYNNIDVVLGGGSQYLTNRADREDLMKVIESKGYTYVSGRSSLMDVKSGKVWGMFAPVGMAYEMDRSMTVEPSLSDMTKKAIELLSQNKNGFFLMVEGSKVDWAAHANDPIGTISDTLAFDDAVKVALDYAKSHQDTMIIVASDHGNGGITIGSSATNSSYDKDNLDKFLAPLKKATLTGEGLEKKLNADRSNIKDVMSTYYGITDLTAAEETAIRNAKAGSMNAIVGPMISTRAAIGWTTTGHTGEEVTLYTYLPGDQRITGVIDNTDIAKIIAKGMNVDLNALTQKEFVDISAAFSNRGITSYVDKTDVNNPKFIAYRGTQSLTIPANKNFIVYNGKTINYDSVMVYNGEKFFVPQAVIDLFAPIGETPVRALIENAGGSVDCNWEEQSITFVLGDTLGKLYIGSDIMEVNGELVTLPDPVVFKGGRVIVSQADADAIMVLK
ncbi:MAG: alkaline phosphatase, partial [Clostridia bacterium]|nr:alkaline phosphatase [Clostridia bacterium]